MTSSRRTLVVPGSTRPARRLTRSRPRPRAKRPLRARRSSAASRAMTPRGRLFFLSGASSARRPGRRVSAVEARDDSPPAVNPSRATRSDSSLDHPSILPTGRIPALYATEYAVVAQKGSQTHYLTSVLVLKDIIVNGTTGRRGTDRAGDRLG